MGYTHYWTQRKNFTQEQWVEVCENIGAILKDVEHNQGIPLANGSGDAGTSPEITPDHIYFNGLGDDSHETFCLHRRRPPKEAWQSAAGSDFCKTARKPYDLAVTACICYLATVTETHSVSSDGDGLEWLDGLEEARRSLPRYANVLDIPRPILEDDRWICPHVSRHQEGYHVRFCVDGFGYIIERTGAKRVHRFGSHKALAVWLENTKHAPCRRSLRLWDGSLIFAEPNIWNATGAFDKHRTAQLGRMQSAACRKLLDNVANNIAPPTLVRPNEFPPMESQPYYWSDLLKESA